MESSIATRVRLGLLALDRQMKDLREALGVSKQVLSNVINAPRQESKHYAAMARFLHCTETWLVTGDGPAPSWYTNPSGEVDGDPSHDGRHLTDKDRFTRNEVMIDALLKRIEGLSEENATLHGQIAASEALVRRLKLLLKDLRTLKK